MHVVVYVLIAIIKVHNFATSNSYYLIGIWLSYLYIWKDFLQINGNPENPEKSSEEDYKRLYYTKDTKRISPIESFPVKVYWFEKMISL